MLEGVLAALLERIAGKYVDGIDKKAAKLSVWRGHVVLKNLSLKSTVLDDMDLPFKLKYGRLDEMSLDIPWKNIRSQPIVVHLSGLYIIFSPNVCSTSTAAEMQAKQLQTKRAMVAELDTHDLNGVLGEEVPSSFSSRLITKMVDNMQLKISNIHLRYEDQYADADHPFALGIMLQSFSAESTDTEWRPCFVEDQKVLESLAEDKEVAPAGRCRLVLKRNAREHQLNPRALEPFENAPGPPSPPDPAVAAVAPPPPLTRPLRPAARNARRFTLRMGHPSHFTGV